MYVRMSIRMYKCPYVNVCTNSHICLYACPYECQRCRSILMSMRLSVHMSMHMSTCMSACRLLLWVIGQAAYRTHAKVRFRRHMPQLALHARRTHVRLCWKTANMRRACVCACVCAYVAHVSRMCRACVAHMSRMCCIGVAHVSRMCCISVAHVLHMCCTGVAHVLHMCCACVCACAAHVSRMCCTCVWHGTMRIAPTEAWWYPTTPGKWPALNEERANTT